MALEPVVVAPLLVPKIILEVLNEAFDFLIALVLLLLRLVENHVLVSVLQPVVRHEEVIYFFQDFV